MRLQRRKDSRSSAAESGGQTAASTETSGESAPFPRSAERLDGARVRQLHLQLLARSKAGRWQVRVRWRGGMGCEQTVTFGSGCDLGFGCKHKAPHHNHRPRPPLPPNANGSGSAHEPKGRS
ncbi:hypothetical protein SKAU_G00353600 [Synaphobranchus kaupii]|uniref:Uncharacterized protein n=1 Tax=Synaphobranchus kaupii TaxID=118154 RepID=A0A9Q1II67_SYNKA|nr:hypothetical protein SKAU_G00353600 [Synaphobranchus kaupii]